MCARAYGDNAASSRPIRVAPPVRALAEQVRTSCSGPSYPLWGKREHPLVYRRALAYFTPDWAWICVLVLLIGVSVLVGLLEAWPLAVLIDSVPTSQPKGDWVHGLFWQCCPTTADVALAPERRVLQVIKLDDPFL